VEGYSHRNGGLCARAGLADVGPSGTVTWLLRLSSSLSRLAEAPEFGYERL
jgi:hypothetical protein